MFNTPRREPRPEPGSGVKVIAYVDEPIDSLVRRFKKAVEKGAVLTDLRRRAYFVKRSERKRIKAAMARKRQSL